ncbi:7504_t:CDS:2 [Entrophospora sp. SA101]|nr:7504_t:CDS:2 [Entrophospora sp. SA101]
MTYKNVKSSAEVKNFWENNIVSQHRRKIWTIESSDAARKNIKESKSLIRDLWSTVKDDVIILKVYYAVSVNNLNEDTFSHNHITPLLSSIFSNTELLECEWSNNELNASSYRKQKFDPCLEGRKPDFSVYVSAYKHKAHLLVAEFKPPRNKGQRLWGDLVKLGNEMKDVIDKIIEDDGVDRNVAVCGIIVQGKYLINDSFRPFYLHQNQHDLGVISTAIELLLYAKYRV